MLLLQRGLLHHHPGHYLLWIVSRLMVSLPVGLTPKGAPDRNFGCSEISSALWVVRPTQRSVWIPRSAVDDAVTRGVPRQIAQPVRYRDYRARIEADGGDGVVLLVRDLGVGARSVATSAVRRGPPLHKRPYTPWAFARAPLL